MSSSDGCESIRPPLRNLQNSIPGSFRAAPPPECSAIDCGEGRVHVCRADDVQDLVLVDDLARTSSPAKSVLWTAERDHANAMILGVATGTAADDDVLTRFQRLSGDALTTS